jgi:uncharacterized protein YndB with AHSA1/START domain
MDLKLSAKVQTDIHAPASKVWDALTNPEIIKQYFFGVEVVSDWKEGSPIVYRGEWEGKTFEDKGNVIQLVPEKLLLCNYWSAFSGLPDSPENYQDVSYELSPVEGGTRLTITQEGIPTEESRKHSEENWKTVLAALKSLLEK